MLIGVRGRGRGLRMKAGTGHPFSTHIVLNCNVSTRLGLQESKCIEIGMYQASPGSLCRGSKGRGRGLRMQAGAGQPFSTHIALNYNVGTRLGLKESKCVEIGINQVSPGSLCRYYIYVPVDLYARMLEGGCNSAEMVKHH